MGFFVLVFPTNKQEKLNGRSTNKQENCGLHCNLCIGRSILPLLVWKNVLSLLKPQPSNEKSFSFLVLDLFFSDVKKSWILTCKVFFSANHQFESNFNYSFFQQKFGHSRVRILFYTIISPNLTLLVRSSIWHQRWSFVS